MLILNRKVDESFVLHTSDGPITVVLKQISGRNTAHIGIDAPRSVNIVRSELECKHNWKECEGGYCCQTCNARINHEQIREKQRATRKAQVDN